MSLTNLFLILILKTNISNPIIDFNFLALKTILILVVKSFPGVFLNSKFLLWVMPALVNVLLLLLLLSKLFIFKILLYCPMLINQYNLSNKLYSSIYFLLIFFIRSFCFKFYYSYCDI